MHHAICQDGKHRQAYRHIEPIAFEIKTNYSEYYARDRRSDQEHETKLHDGVAAQVEHGSADSRKSSQLGKLAMEDAIIHDIAAMLREIQNSEIGRAHVCLNSSHPSISYAVFCLKKKKINVN